MRYAFILSDTLSLIQWLGKDVAYTGLPIFFDYPMLSIFEE